MHAWNRTQSKADPLAALGNTVRATVAEAVRQATSWWSLLENGPAVVEHVLFHAGAANHAPRHLFIDMASIQPARRATTPHGLVKWAWRTWMLQCLAAR